MDHPAGGQVAVGGKLQPRHGAWPVDRLAEYQRGQSCGKVLQAVHAGPRDLSGDSASERIELESGPGQGWRETDRTATDASLRADRSAPDEGGEGARPRHRARVMRCSPATVKKALTVALEGKLTYDHL